MRVERPGASSVWVKVKIILLINTVILTEWGQMTGIQFCFQLSFAQRMWESHFISLGFHFFAFEWV